MQPLRVETFEPAPLKDALVIVAFPTTGSAASIAAHYLCRHLELPLVGHLQAPEAAGIMAVQDGRATSPLRIFGGETKCNLAKGCPRVYVLLTELAMAPSMVGRVADAVLDWAKSGGAHLVLCLEGVVRSQGDDTPDVFIASAQADVLDELKRTGTPAMSRALIGGLTSFILLGAPGRGVRGGTLMVEANRDFPDGRAAAALITALDKILPEVHLDAGPLLKEATELEAELERLQASAQDNVPPPSTGQFI